MAPTCGILPDRALALVRMVLAGILLAAAVGWSSAAAPATAVFESPAAPPVAGRIDELVFAQLARLNLPPVLCSDAVFVRRAFLDITGTLPTAAEVRAFLADPDTANKRRRLIDTLLERPEYADYWAMKWGDLLRIKAEFPVNLWPNAAQAYHRWVRAAVASNLPYDRFARELLTASGSNFRVGPANFYRAIQNRTPEGIAVAVALTFMGARAENWPAERRADMAVFFSQVGYKPTSEWKEEHVFWDPLGTSAATGNTAPGRPAVATIAETLAKAPAVAPVPPSTAPDKPRNARLPDGTTVVLPPDRDPREVFADWLVDAKNPSFTHPIANRVWSWFLGRGIVQEPDDFRADNPPANPALLAYLADELVSHRFDLKHLFRLILNSSTYQMTAMPRGTTPEAAAAFASYPLRRLDAEVLIDAINRITGTTDLYTSPIPEPYTYIPADMPAVAIADGSITSPFLALFGRSARATGMENERDHKPVPAQWLHLLNSSHIQRKLEQGPKLKAVLDSGKAPAAVVEELYLTFLSRFPTEAEQKEAATLGQLQTVRPAKGAKAPPGPPKTVLVKRREDWLDLAWALLNSSEFLFRH
ncbi:MAG: DUF1553 domain-containing protein [Verrucomicrobia bacterium]|nr:DUF1553 domain-containing protein [Verrucomicrobiota bacterium]